LLGLSNIVIIIKVKWKEKKQHRYSISRHMLHVFYPTNISAFMNTLCGFVKRKIAQHKLSYGSIYSILPPSFPSYGCTHVRNMHYYSVTFFCFIHTYILHTKLEKLLVVFISFILCIFGGIVYNEIKTPVDPFAKRLEIPVFVLL